MYDLAEQAGSSELVQAGVTGCTKKRVEKNSDASRASSIRITRWLRTAGTRHPESNHKFPSNCILAVYILNSSSCCLHTNGGLLVLCLFGAAHHTGPRPCET